METISDEANFQAISVFQNSKNIDHNYLKTNGLQNLKGIQPFKLRNPLIISMIKILLERNESRDYFHEKRFIF